MLQSYGASLSEEEVVPPEVNLVLSPQTPPLLWGGGTVGVSGMSITISSGSTVIFRDATISLDGNPN